MSVKYFDSHDFTNNSDEVVSIMVEPGEVVRVQESGRPMDYGDYSGEQFGNEVEVPPGARVETLVFPQ